jgi:hypothetical protein
LELRPGVNRFGRTEENDFCIEHPTVSSRHCEVVWENDMVLVRDCDSTNGTFIDGQPVREGRLLPGQTLYVGSVEMVLEPSPVTVTIPTVEPPKPPTPTRMPDGAPACLNHPEVRAAWKCTQCHHEFCNPCVHHLRRVGGKFLNLCPSCSGHCEYIGPKKKKKSFLAFLQKTLKLPFKRGSRT